MDKNKKNFLVYIHEFPNGKTYIGITSRKPHERWKGGHGYRHQPQIWEAIVAYGWKNIAHRIIKEGLSQPEAEELERILIKTLRSNEPTHGYNIENGGISGNTVSDTTRQKHREAKKGEKNPFYGKQLTEEHKDKIRETRKARNIQPVNKQLVRCVETGVIYESTAQATRELGIHNYAIRRVCYGERKTAGGYHWEYVAHK